jgi:hypothetical protein
MLFQKEKKSKEMGRMGEKGVKGEKFKKNSRKDYFLPIETLFIFPFNILLHDQNHNL